MISRSFELILTFRNAMHLDQKVSLKALHTFGMEVEARYFVEAKTHSEVLTLLNYRHMIHMPILFLGCGSNVLFTRNFGGIVIRINSKGIVIRDEDENHVHVTAEAGENWDEFVQHCVDREWSGLENLSLIPGTVGASPIQNIGAYGVEVKDTIESVQVIEIDSGKQKRFTNAECQFGYRDSIFKRALKGKVIILNVTFRLNKTGVTGLQGDRVMGNSLLKLDYGDLRPELGRMGVIEPTISDVRAAVCSIRRRKLPDPAEIGNAGSFFKNPVISKKLLDSLQTGFPEMPVYLQSPGDDAVSETFAKIPAAWLIEQCGWKGYRSGDAGVHPNQPLVLVNYGNATGPQILGLANHIISSVEQKFGIRLETEVNVIG
ncbi:MAG: UDP-N-acetylmuramate dehydrogenase [Bacteroidetes bacterium]|nr:UDP-N-acetylmuramate dehydrogenase [Bacteroidota bacterium]